MGKDYKRAATSSKAAENLVKDRKSNDFSGYGRFGVGSNTSSGGFTFGAKYISQVAPEQTGNTAAAVNVSPAIPLELDSELAQQLQKLSKRDATTRLKSLQMIKVLIPEKNCEDATAMLSPWAYSFCRLVMDSNRSVRAEACTVMGILATIVGRRLVPFLKIIIPAWFLAQHDDFKEVAAAATSGMEATFPGSKSTGALLFCRSEVLTLLSENLRGTPQSLGDPKKESPEELQERHARVHAASLAATGSLIEVCASASATHNAAVNDVFDCLKDIFAESSFVRAGLLSKSPRVRCKAYNLISLTCRTASDLLEGDTLRALAPSAFGCLGDKDHNCHQAMWDMVLTLASTCPGVWDTVNLHKAILPRLWVLLRHAGYGSATITFPAVLPFVALLPKSAMGISLFETLLTATWQGVCAAGDSPAQQAAIDCFVECLVFAFLKSDTVAQEDPNSFCSDLLQRILPTTILSLDTFQTIESLKLQAALSYATERICAHAEGSSYGQAKLDTFLSIVGSSLGEIIRQSVVLDGESLKASIGLNAVGVVVLHLAAVVPGRTAPLLLPTARALVPHVQQAPASPAATALLASLVHKFPNFTALISMCSIDACAADGDRAGGVSVDTGEITVESILDRIEQEDIKGAVLKSSCSLMSSLILQNASPANLLAISLSELMRLRGPEGPTTLLGEILENIDGDDAAKFQSTKLDDFCSHTCLRGDIIYLPLVEKLLTGTGSASFLTECGQDVVLQCLLDIARDNDNAHHIDAFKTACSAAMLDSLIHGISITALRLDIAKIAFKELVRHAPYAPALDVEHSNSDGEEYDGEYQHTDLHATALSLWNNSSFSIGRLVQSASRMELKVAFVDELSLLLADALRSIDSLHVEQLQELVRCAVAAFRCFNGDPNLERRFVFGIRSNCTQQDILVLLGESVGFDNILSLFEHEISGVIYDLLAVSSGIDMAKKKLRCYVIENPTLLEDALRRAWKVASNEGCFVLDSLMRAAFENPRHPAAAAAALFFQTDVVGTQDMRLLTNILICVAASLRSNENLVQLSSIKQLSITLCGRAAIESTDAELLSAAAACFPCAHVHTPVAIPFACSTSSLERGAYAWYRHGNGSWEATEIIAVDRTVDPPSYGVQLSTGVRETECSRLAARKENEQSPRDAGFVSPSLDVPPISSEELNALVALWRGMPQSAELSSCAVRVLRSTVSYCWQELEQADWIRILAFLENVAASMASNAAKIATDVAAIVISEATGLAGASLGGARRSLQFFRRLTHKGVLQLSDKGSAARAAVGREVEKGLQQLYEIHGVSMMNVVQSYRAIQAVCTTSRTLPFLAWESAQASICSTVLDVFVTLGGIVSMAGACGAGAALSDSMRNVNAGPMWNSVCDMARSTVVTADESFLLAAAHRADSRSESIGIDCIDALIALALSPATPETVQKAARYILMSNPALLELLSVAGVGFRGEEDAIIRAIEASEDAFEAFEAVGVRSEIAEAVILPSHPSSFTAWGILLAHLMHLSQDSSGRQVLVQCVKDARGNFVSEILDTVVGQLPLDAGSQSRRASLGKIRPVVETFTQEDTAPTGFCRRMLQLEGDHAVGEVRRSYAALLYAGMLRTLAVPCRLWFADLRDRSASVALEKYTAAAVSPALLDAEFAMVEELAGGIDRFEKISIRSNPAAREVLASLEVEDGHFMELTVRLPVCFPLRAPEAECRRSVGVTEARLRKWLLSITAFLRNRNSAVAGAIQMWKRNVDSEFEGHDECLICYSIIQPSTGDLPRLACRTCRKHFHGACIYKWFRSSGKSTCPHCQSPW